jgi:VanZ family protein
VIRHPQKFRLPLQFLLAAYWLLIFTLTHLPPRHLPHVNLWDKIQHLLAYGCLATLLFLTLWLTRPRLAQLGIVVLAICMMYGAVDEWLQIPVGRDCELVDWFADTSGAAIAVVGLTFIRRFRKR